MDGKSFAKMCKDTKLIDKKMTATDVDLIFAKSKNKTDRRITFDQFITALNFCAEKKQVGNNDVYMKVASSKGPILKGTKAENVALHDDKTLYTGVYAKGGPTNFEKDKYHHLDNLLDRTEADVRGRKIDHMREEQVQQVTHKVAGLVVEEEKKEKRKSSA